MNLKKKLLYIFIFGFMATIIFNAKFYNEKQIEYNLLTSSGSNSNTKNIVFSIGSKKPNDVYNILKPLLNTYKANLFTVDVSGTGNFQTTTKYVYCDDVGLFKDLPLISGRFFNDQEYDSTKYLSTQKTDIPNQIAQIADFSGDNNFEIRTLKSGIDANLFTKSFTLQLANMSQFNSFKDSLSQQGIQITDNSAMVNGGTNTYQFALFMTIAITLFVLLLLIIYDLLNSYKKIGIEKMLGFNRFSIWLKRVVPLIFIQIGTFVVALIFNIIFDFKTYNFLVRNFIIQIILINLIILLISLIFISLPFIYTKRIKILDMLKNKHPTTSIIYFNVFVKIVLSVAVVSLSFGVYIQAQLINSRYNNSFSAWENTKPYAYIPSIDSKNGYLDWTTKQNEEKWRNIYLDFNKTGAILADFTCFSPDELKLEKNNKPYQMFITINPNYLKEHPSFDAQNHQISIPESEKDFILLVPEKYKDIQQSILDWYQPDAGKNQLIKIVWVKNNQKYFSYRLDINPAEYNYVLDPIVSVLTSSNGQLAVYSVSVGSPGNPFMIKVNNEQNPAAEINPVLEKYFDLSKITFPAVSVYNNVSDQIQAAKNEIKTYSIILIILLTLIITIIIQNVLNYFEQNRRILAIKHFMGYKKLNKYIGLLAMVAISFPILSVLSFLIVQNIQVLLFALIFTLFELGISVLFIVGYEKKNILKMIKGG